MKTILAAAVLLIPLTAQSEAGNGCQQQSFGVQFIPQIVERQVQDVQFVPQIFNRTVQEVQFVPQILQGGQFGGGQSFNGFQGGGGVSVQVPGFSGQFGGQQFSGFSGGQQFSGGRLGRDIEFRTGLFGRVRDLQIRPNFSGRTNLVKLGALGRVRDRIDITP